MTLNIKEDFENIESRFNKWGVFYEFHDDILKKGVKDGATIRTRDYAVALYLKWYELNKVNAEVIFDREYKHPEEEYKEIELLMKQYGFHIIKPKR